MPARRLTDVSIVVGAGIAVAVLVTVGAFLAPPADAADSGTSTYSAGPRGMKAAYLTLAELGYRVGRSIEPVTALRAEPSETTVILSGEEPLSEQDRRAIREFVEQGGTLLAIGANGGHALGLIVPTDVNTSPFDDRVQPFAALTPSAVSKGAAEILARSEGPRPTFTDVYVPLYGKSVDDLVAAVASIGKGRAIWLADGTPFSNAHLDEADNLRLLLNVVGDPSMGRVLFDEHYQGYKRSLWSYTVGTPLPWIALQAGLIMAAVLLTYSRRQGPVRAAHVDARTSPIEFVDMLAGLYKRANARQAAVNAARMRLRRTIAASCGVPAATGDEALARAAGAKLRTDSVPIGELLDEADRAAGDPNLEKDRAMSLMGRLQELSRRLTGMGTDAADRFRSE